MIPFRRILFPVDYSDACLAVVPHVKAMARQFSSELTLVRAFGIPPVEMMDVGMGADGPFLAMEKVEELQLDRLREFAASNFPGIPVRAVVKFAEPASAIEDEVKRGGADLVMLATHGHGAFRRALLGSVTAKVLHDVSCAVWTGTHETLVAAPKTAIQCKSIVCALGLTEESEAVLRAAGALARDCGASLHIVHSVETPPAAYEIDFGAFRTELIEAAELALRKLVAEAEVDATIRVDSGPAALVIRSQACAYDADLVVTGRGHSQGRAARVWSALYSIVREAPCPVISI